MARRRERGEAGVSTVEVVIVVPIMLVFILALVAIGIYADAVGVVQNSAQDGARMASLQPGTDSRAFVQGVAANAVQADLGTLCNNGGPGQVPTVAYSPVQEPVPAGVQLPPGATYNFVHVQVTCQITVMGVNLTVVRSADTPVDVFREQPQ